MLKNYKILYLFLFLFAFIFLFSSQCFAFTIGDYNFSDFTTFSGQSTSDWDNYNYILVEQNPTQYNQSDGLWVYCWLKTADVIIERRESNEGYGYYIKPINDGDTNRFFSSFYDRDFTRYSGSSSSFSEKCWLFSSTSTSDTSVLASSVNIYQENTDTVVFPPPPQKGEEILAPVVEQVEMSQTLSEIVKLLPLILVVVVSLVGLRKGLAMLFKVLRTS